ncbi:O-antigen ligase family protein [Periweissella ghanensis]|nr:O-antigen ligase family protein [Periweissella ghanensis]
MLIFNLSAYANLTTILTKYSLGLVDFVNGSPRVFFKVSPIFGFFFIRQMDILLSNGFKFKNCIYAIAGLLASIASITIGIWIGIGIAMIFLLLPYLKKLNLQFVIIVLGVSIAGILLIHFDILKIFQNRLSSTDFSRQQKTTQLFVLLSQIQLHPIFGSGFGETLTINSPVGIRNQTQFELSFLQVIMNTGLIGFSFFASILISPYNTFFKLNDRFKDMSKGNILGLIVIITASTVNPFITNPIGIGCFLLVAISIDRFSELSDKSKIVKIRRNYEF